jgi:ferredoxin
MRVTADRDQCVSSGACVSICKQVFAQDEEGIVVVLDETPPEALRPEVQDAEESCPSACIEVED